MAYDVECALKICFSIVWNLALAEAVPKILSSLLSFSDLCTLVLFQHLVAPYAEICASPLLVCCQCFKPRGCSKSIWCSIQNELGQYLKGDSWDSWSLKDWSLGWSKTRRAIFWLPAPQCQISPRAHSPPKPTQYSEEDQSLHDWGLLLTLPPSPRWRQPSAAHRWCWLGHVSWVGRRELQLRAGQAQKTSHGHCLGLGTHWVPRSSPVTPCHLTKFEAQVIEVVSGLPSHWALCMPSSTCSKSFPLSPWRQVHKCRGFLCKQHHLGFTRCWVLLQ